MKRREFSMRNLEGQKLSWSRGRPPLYALLAALLGGGCAATPTQHFDDAAAARGLARSERTGVPFVHVLFRKDSPRAGGSLDIYLDGDGTPALSARRLTRDPTPRGAVVLDLMAADPNPALLVGRPCYHLRRPDPACGPAWWTERRYAPEIVASMAAVIERELAGHPDVKLTLVGYSGGGALAMLIAPRLSRLDRVVTVAANLDTDAWVAFHGYAPLSGSLNPAREPPLDARVSQLHLVGAADRVVPAAIVRAAVARQPHAELRVLPGYDHDCCWVRTWPPRR